MTRKVPLNRRRFLAANAAAAAAATLPVAAVTSLPGAASAATGPAPAPAPRSWASVTQAELQGLIGQRFRIGSQHTGNLVMELVAVEPVNSGPARPADLGRSEGVIAVFDSPDKAPIVDCGCGIYRVSHAQLGAADLYMGPSPLRHGGHVLELVLN